MSEHIDIDHELITIRHYLHAHPERSFREFGTSIYLTDQLKAHGIEILHNPLETVLWGSFRARPVPGRVSGCALTSTACPSWKTPDWSSAPSMKA